MRFILYLFLTLSEFKRIINKKRENEVLETNTPAKARELLKVNGYH